IDEPLNRLTSKEIAEGWILLFDGKTTFGWKIEGDATIKDGVLILGGERETTAQRTTVCGHDWEVKFESSTGDSGAYVKWRQAPPGERGQEDGAELTSLNERKQSEWHSNTVRVTETRRIMVDSSRFGTGRRSHFGAKPIPGHEERFGFSVPADGKLYVRSV